MSRERLARKWNLRERDIRNKILYYFEFLTYDPDKKKMRFLRDLAIVELVTALKVAK